MVAYHTAGGNARPSPAAQAPFLRPFGRRGRRHAPGATGDIGDGSVFDIAVSAKGIKQEVSNVFAEFTLYLYV